MIITRTPFRISFAGGGTDLQRYYRTGYGAVVSATINKYMYITVNRRFDDTIRVSYSKTEIVDCVDKIRHSIVREALKLVGIDHGIEITSVSDIPAGTGLGSSSSFTVGLLNALYTFRGQQRSSAELAEQACHIEIDILGKPIGKQDQYAAAFGGLGYYRFNSDETVDYEPITLDEPGRRLLNERLTMWYTGTTRCADSILEKQNENTPNHTASLDRMRSLADGLHESLAEKGPGDDFATVLNQGWLEKKTLAGGITNDRIDSLWETALSHGALGGKLLGAGGSGFLLFYTKPCGTADLAASLRLPRLPFRLSHHGSCVIFLSED